MSRRSWTDAPSICRQGLCEIPLSTSAYACATTSINGAEKPLTIYRIRTRTRASTWTSSATTAQRLGLRFMIV